MGVKSFAFAFAVAAFAIVFSMVLVADAMDSSSEESEFNDKSFPQLSPFMAGDKEDGAFPMDRAMGPRDQMRGVPDFMDRPVDDRMFAKNPKDGDQMMGPRPGSEMPRYNHDADPEVMKELIGSMMEDVSRFDPAFVEDVIVFAEENGMDEIAKQLAQKLAENYANYMDVFGNIYSLDTRASGVDDDQDDDSDFELVEEEDEEDPLNFSVPNESLFIPFLKPVDAHTLFQCMQLDI